MESEVLTTCLIPSDCIALLQDVQIDVSSAPPRQVGNWHSPECQGKNWDGLHQPKDCGGIQDIALPHAQKVAKEVSTFQAHSSNEMNHSAKPINTKWSSILCIIDIQITAGPLAQGM